LKIKTKNNQIKRDLINKQGKVKYYEEKEGKTFVDISLNNEKG